MYGIACTCIGERGGPAGAGGGNRLNSGPYGAFVVVVLALEEALPYPYRGRSSCDPIAIRCPYKYCFGEVASRDKLPLAAATQAASCNQRSSRGPLLLLLCTIIFISILQGE